MLRLLEVISCFDLDSVRPLLYSSLYIEFLVKSLGEEGIGTIVSIFLKNIKISLGSPY